MNKLADKRVEFVKGGQKKFLDQILKRAGCNSFRVLSKQFRIGYSALKKYHKEELFIPLSLVENLCNKFQISINSLSIKEIKESNWGAIKGGKKGMKVMLTKYKSSLSEWRRRAQLGNTNRLRKINIPKLDENLAEFIGAYLGDGTITKNFIRISGDIRYDKNYFNYLSNLIENLFNIKTSTYKEKNKNTFYLLICSKKLCSFLNKNFNIKFGDKIKNNTRIPKEIITDKKLAIACLRGLVDTDGSVSVRGRNKSQFCVQFANHNKQLLRQVYMIGKKLDIFTYFTGNETGTNKWNNILKYFAIVGSSNTRHIVRFYVKYKEGKALNLNDALSYYNKDFKLPFKIRAHGPSVTIQP